jgi:UDPglucose--hexose-1-phosphate uridylyltransferase
MRDFAAILKETLLRLDLCLGDPPYNFMLLTTDFSENFHWHMEIIPRLTIAAGFELGTGIYLNVVSPEDAAAYLRAVNTTGLHTTGLL